MQLVFQVCSPLTQTIGCTHHGTTGGCRGWTSPSCWTARRTTPTVTLWTASAPAHSRCRFPQAASCLCGLCQRLWSDIPSLILWITFDLAPFRWRFHMLASMLYVIVCPMAHVIASLHGLRYRLAVRRTLGHACTAKTRVMGHFTSGLPSCLMAYVIDCGQPHSRWRLHNELSHRTLHKRLTSMDKPH